tara:strand:- start:283 stop:564 length:282 start_codon:yes stop_codon:yes gene_type:complete
MGNCLGFLNEYKKKYINESNAISVSNVPIGTPLYFDSNNSQNPNLNYINSINNANNANVIVIQHQPYYDNGLNTMNSFLTGMLVGEILSDDCL